jgi:putative ABC transport system permease protein
MIRHWLILAWRAVSGAPAFAAISITSLSVGCACALLIGAYVHQELTMDHWVPASERIIRIETTTTLPGQEPNVSASSASGLGPALRDSVEGVELMMRITQAPVQVRTGDGQTTVFPGLVDANFFEMVPRELSEGDPATALDDPKGVILHPNLRDQLFGEGPAVGRTVEIVGSGDAAVVTGVFAPAPSNRRFQFAMLARIDAPFLPQRPAPLDANFSTPNVSIYMRADTTARAREWRRTLPAIAHDILERNAAIPDGAKVELWVIPLRDMYLGALKAGANVGVANRQRLALFGLVAAALLAVAAFNYVSLSLARVVRRTREVGLRKAMGATRGDLVRQHLAESALLTAIAMALGFGLAALTLPWFARALQLPFLVSELFRPAFLGMALAAGAAIVVLVAAYPAVFLAGVRPSSILQGSRGPLRAIRAGVFAIVAIQFVAATALGASVAVFYAQSSYLARGNLGFAVKDRVTLLAGQMNPRPYAPPDVAEQNLSRKRRLEAELAGRADIIALGGSSLPIMLTGADFYEGQRSAVFTPERPDDEAGQALPVLVDFGFFETMEVEPVAGRLFSEDLGADRVLLDNPGAQPALLPVVVSRAFLPIIGASTPDAAIGRRFIQQPQGAPAPSEHEIVGVVDDLLVVSAREPPLPLVFHPNPGGASILVARIDGARRRETMAALTAALETLSPGENNDVVDMEQMADNRLAEDRRWRLLVTVAAGVAIVLASAGLFGLTGFSASQGRREVGVRKALGADRSDVMTLMVLRFVRPALVGIAIGWLVAYFPTAGWLRGFAVHVPLTPAPFLLAGAAALVIAVATVLAHALAAARASPTVILRHD